jgi:AcrR family transcriptional regulator
MTATGKAAAAPRPRRTQAERSAETRQRLIAAAIDALCRLGYAATSTVLVADNAGVSRGAMLHQFPSKGHLMAAVVEASVEADYAAYIATIEPIEDPVEQIIAIIDTGWDQFRSPSGVAQTEIWMATRSDPELAEAVLPVHEEIFARSLGAQVRRFARAGITDIRDVRTLLYLNVATLRGLAIEHVLGTPEEILRPAIDCIKIATLAHIRAAQAATRSENPDEE